MVIRERKTDLLKDRTKASHAAIEQKSQEYDEKFKATLKEISAYQNQLRSDAQARTQAMFDKVKSENSAELANSKKQIAEEANVARNNLKAEISGIMGQIVQMVTK
jgi:F0F1-type ATP synthase membrane subunit b/b'